MKQEQNNLELKPIQNNGVFESKNMSFVDFCLFNYKLLTICKEKLTPSDLDTAALMLLHEQVSQQRWGKQDDMYTRQIFREMERFGSSLQHENKVLYINLLQV